MSNPVSEALVTVGRGYLRHAPTALGKAPLSAHYLNPRLRDHPRQRVVRTRFGARFAVDTTDLIQRYLYMYGIWEPHMTRWLGRRLRPGDTFIDVGSNIGYYSVLASRLVGGAGRVVAVEASPTFHRRVLQHARLNGCGNIRAVNSAVSDRNQMLKFILASSRNMGATSTVPYEGPAESTFEIESHPLPEILAPQEIANARVIKIDVEGAEGSVVRGLAPILGKLRPDAEITVEVTPDRMRQLGDDVTELLATMHEHGFHTYRLTNDYAPESYPAALSGPASVPIRWRAPVDSESDLVFSRVDAESLP
ncbi:FkbM family methyltransferase [Streptomyces sp. BPTC-684]|uniref:FkbM family methyltransferase n=1 Tax=Streptomyces sp. BPTC-684 TaxID=3043734 RepID=UPI0024B14F9F|nr:FkbM family methyltransferase [Streptomyces sp. BPTC-684]WHM37426.1 FkbM family methyltransferase [Streptomyces sp. BPTC-684]